MGIAPFLNVRDKKQKPLSLQNAGTRAKAPAVPPGLTQTRPLLRAITRRPFDNGSPAPSPILRISPFCLPSRVHSSARPLLSRTVQQLSEKKQPAEYSSRSSVWAHHITNDLKCQVFFAFWTFYFHFMVQDSLQQHPDVGDAVFQELPRNLPEPELFIKAPGISLGFEIDRVRTKNFPRCLNA